jgi:Tol biopolymer transport system component
MASGQLSSPPVRPARQFKGYNSSPEWSSDGKFMAFASRRDIPAPISVSPGVIPILSMETGQVVRELMPAIFYGGIGRWSPDGRLFIARGTDLKGRDGIVKIDAATGETTFVVPNETCSGIPHWAPDGRSFFCYHFGDQDPGIVQVDVTSGAVLRSSPVAGQGWAVSPDGKYLVYALNDALGLIELATGHTREILKLTPADQFGNAFSLDCTPDSRAVVFYGKLHGDQGMWYVPIDGHQPHKINLDLGPIYSWRFNPTTGQVAFSTDGIMAHLEMWKMEHFLPSADAATQ